MSFSLISAKIRKDSKIKISDDSQANIISFNQDYSLISIGTNNGYKIDDISLDLHHSEYPFNIMTEYEEKFSKQDNLIYYVNAIKK